MNIFEGLFGIWSLLLFIFANEALSRFQGLACKITRILLIPGYELVYGANILTKLLLCVMRSTGFSFNVQHPSFLWLVIGIILVLFTIIAGKVLSKEILNVLITVCGIIILLLFIAIYFPIGQWVH